MAVAGGEEDELYNMLHEILDSDDDEDLVKQLRRAYIEQVLGPRRVREEQQEVDGEPLLNKDGSARQVNRENYSRGPKTPKIGNPWETCKYLLLIEHPDTSDPSTRKGKEFRRKIRMPLQVFRDIVQMCRETGEQAFNYNERVIGGGYSIPLELKVLSALRVLACGAGFDLVADACGFMSNTTCNAFFKDFVRLFAYHYEDKFIAPLQGVASSYYLLVI